MHEHVGSVVNIPRFSNRGLPLNNITRNDDIDNEAPFKERHRARHELNETGVRRYFKTSIILINDEPYDSQHHKPEAVAGIAKLR